MKIDSEQLLATVNKFKNASPEKSEVSETSGKKTKTQGTDRVEFSGRQVEVDRLKKTMQDGTDIRSDKVAQIKAQIEAGTYQVSGTEVAKKMLKAWSDLNGK
jgi:negative regulator of flagellin synthesis FlgM